MFEFFLALLAGMATVGGPCILPLLPIILGTSTVNRHPLRPVAIVFGFSLAFTGFALAFSVFTSFFGISPTAWRWIATILIGLFGFVMIFPRLQLALFARLEPLVPRLTPKQTPGQTDLMSGVLLGISLGIIWTPCAGPILGSILTLIAAKQQLPQAAALLFAFALGASVPMLLIAYGGQVALKRVRALNRYTAVLQRVFGCIILLVAIGIGTRADIWLLSYLLEHTPWLFLTNRFHL